MILPIIIGYVLHQLMVHTFRYKNCYYLLLVVDKFKYNLDSKIAIFY